MLSDNIPTAQNASKPHNLIDQIQLTTSKLLSARLRGMFDAVNSALIDLANNPDNKEEYALYMDGVREWGKQRQKIEEAFIVGMNESFAGFMQGMGAKQSSSEDDEPTANEMSLVDDVELEESLALIDMGEKANNRYPEELYAIEQRFDAC